MDFFDVVHNRRSTRKFASQPVEQAKLDQILEAVLRAPSAKGARPWEFVVVTDPQVLAKLSTSRPGGAGFLKGAAVAVAVCADPQKSGPWIEDATIAAIYIQLSAQSLGLASCWCQMRGREYNDQKQAGEYVAEVLSLPAGLEVECIVGLGYADESKPAYDRKDLLWERVSYNRFGQRSA